MPWSASRKSRSRRPEAAHERRARHGRAARAWVRFSHEKNEPVFHAPWEARVYAMNRAMGAWRKWNLDAGRHAIELLPPADYLRMSYYERWFRRLVARREVWLCDQRGDRERKGRSGLDEGDAGVQPARRLPAGSNRGIPSSRDPSVRPSFKVGQRVRARNINPDRPHALATIRARQDRRRSSRDHGVYVFPDTNAHSGREASARLLRAFRRARALGGARFSARLRLPRPVGRLP